MSKSLQKLAGALAARPTTPAKITPVGSSDLNLLTGEITRRRWSATLQRWVLGEDGAE